MDNIDFSKYDVTIEHDNGSDPNFDEAIAYLQRTIFDRSIPEENKVTVRKQLDELILLRLKTLQPPTIVLTPKKDI